MWYRVFAMTDEEMQPAELLDGLRQEKLDMQAHHFRGDDAGWFEAELVLDNLTLILSRFLVSEKGVRDELNTWAAWVEEQEGNPHRDNLMRKLIAARQVFAAELPEGEKADAPLSQLALALCRLLATRTGGFYQVDGAGFFAVDGTLLIAE
jgi:hypothetical protein